MSKGLKMLNPQSSSVNFSCHLSIIAYCCVFCGCYFVSYSVVLSVYQLSLYTCIVVLAVPAAKAKYDSNIYSWDVDNLPSIVVLLLGSGWEWS